MTEEPADQASGLSLLLRGSGAAYTGGLILLFMVMAAMVWGKSAGFDFVWDDQYYVVTNEALRHGSEIPRYFTDVDTMAGKVEDPELQAKFVLFRPLRNISYFVDYALAGLDPRLWHLHNLVLHVMNALLVVLCGRRLITTTCAPVMAGLLYLVHPVLSEVVCWVKCRDDLLAGFFLLLLFYAWLVFRPRSYTPGRVLLLVLLFVLACLSKIQAVVAPILLLVAAWWLPAPQQTASKLKRDFALFALLMVAGIVCVVWRHLFIGQTSQMGYLAGSLGPTLLTMTRAAVHYLVLLAVPVNLIADYSGMQASTSFTEPRVILSVMVLFILAAATWWGRRKAPLVTFGILWIGICLLPVSNVIPMMQYMAERFLYLPAVGFALLAGAVLSGLENRHRVSAIVLGICWVLLFSVLTFIRIDVWKDEVTLYRSIVEDTPTEVVRPRRNLLSALVNRGEYAEALPLARELHEHYGRDPETPEPVRAEYHRHLGYLLTETGSEDLGKPLLEQAILIHPGYVRPYIDLGIALGKKGQPAAALDYFDQAAKHDPKNSSIQYNRAIALASLGRAKEAEQAYQRAINQAISMPDAFLSYAAMLWQQGRLEEARSVYQEGVRRFPRNPELQKWLAEVQRALPGA